MKNFVQSGDAITIPAQADISAGALVAVGSLVGVAAANATSGEDVVIATKGVFDLAKASGVLNIGDAVEIDGSGAVTALDAGPQIGVVIKAAASHASTARVRIG